MNVKDFKDGIIGVAVFIAMMAAAFFLGRYLGQIDAENEIIESRDTLIVRDTVSFPNDIIQTQLVTQEVIRYKYVPISVAPDTVEKHDTIIQMRDGVAIIPISLKTYTDSSTYKAVVSGYDPRLEEIEIYRENMVITERLAAPRFSIGLQGGLYMTPKGFQPGVGLGVNYRIGD